MYANSHHAMSDEGDKYGPLRSLCLVHSDMYAGTVPGYGRLTRGQRRAMGVEDERDSEMTEPKLTPQSELILKKLRAEEAQERFTHDEQLRIMKALQFFESFGFVAKFVIQLASLITAVGVVLSFWYRR